MSRRSMAVLLAAVLAPSFSIAAAQEKKADQPAALKRLPAGGSDFVLFLLHDPLPHLESLLTNPALKEVLMNGSLAKVMKDVTLDPALAWKAVRDNQHFVPRELALAMPRESVAHVDHLVQSFLLTALCNGAKESGEAAAKDLPKLQREVLAVIKKLEVPRLSVWCRLRNKDHAEQVLSLLKLQMAVRARDWGLKSTAEENALGLQGKVSSMVSPLVLGVMIETFGLVDDDNDPRRAEVRKAVGDIELQVWLERFDDGLRLTLGPRPAADAPPHKPQDLGPLFGAQKNEIAFTRWDIKALKPVVRGWNKLWRRYENTPAGRYVAKADEEDSLGDLRMWGRMIRAAADSGSMHVYSAPGSLHWSTRSLGAPPSASLADSPILRFIPDKIEAAWITSAASLADVVSDFIYQAEERLATRGLQYDLTGRETQAAMADLISRNYYKHFADFRKLIHERFSKVVEPSTAILITSDGKVDQAEVSFVEDGRRRTLRVNEKLPMFEVAAVCRVREGAQFDRFVQDVQAALVKGVFAVMDRKPPADLKLVKRDGVLVGKPVFFYQGDWITRASGEAEVKITLQGDFAPHFFVHEGYAIWSTSPRLSRRIIAPRQRDNSLVPPPQPDFERTVAHGRIPGRTVGRLYSSIFQGAYAFAAASDPRAAEAIKPLRNIGEGLAELAELIDGIRWTAWEKPNVHATHWIVDFRGAAGNGEGE